MRAGASALVLAIVLLAPASASAGPGDPPCTPDNMLNLTLRTQDGGANEPLVATHVARVFAEWSDEVRDPSLSVPDGVNVLSRRPARLQLVVPFGASLAVTATWEQAIDPADPDTRCNATQTIALPITAAVPGRAFYNLQAGSDSDGFSTFAALPDPKRGDLTQLEVSVRVAHSARFPSPRSKARRMPVAMRAHERLRYRRRIPNADLLSTPKRCRFYSLSCDRRSRVFTDVSALGARDPNRRIRKRDLVGGPLLSRVQPFRQVAPYGVRISVVIFSQPGHEPPALGYDVQVRQSGRLIARVRRALRCGKVPNGFGERFYRCRVVRRQNG
jgi:hypothetical protein